MKCSFYNKKNIYAGQYQVVLHESLVFAEYIYVVQKITLYVIITQGSIFDESSLRADATFDTVLGGILL